LPVFSLVAVDHKGMIWFTEHLTNKIGRFSPATHAFQEFPTPSANSMPTPDGHPHDGLRVDSQNRIWFDEEFKNKLAEAQ
jgi:virginiamycin B lyase